MNSVAHRKALDAESEFRQRFYTITRAGNNAAANAHVVTYVAKQTSAIGVYPELLTAAEM